MNGLICVFLLGGFECKQASSLLKEWRGMFSTFMTRKMHDLMDSSSDEGKTHYLDHSLHYEAAQYRVSYACTRNTTEIKYDKHQDFNQKRYPVSCSGNNPGRVKRVVSCKRKTHNLTAVRRKQLGSGRNSDATNKKNEIGCLLDPQQEIFSTDSLEFPLNVNNNDNTSRTGSAQLHKDHKTMTDLLFGRHLRLKVALTLWQRSIEEMLTYLLKIQDTGVVVDFLPVMCKCLDDDSPRITIGCCVDLFPLVRQVLSKQYEEYLFVGFKWIHSVLKRWQDELRTSGFSGSTQQQLDKNFQVFNQQLWELWHQEPHLKSGVAGDMAEIVESFLFQLN